jgi:hypothetical protein
VVQRVIDVHHEGNDPPHQVSSTQEHPAVHHDGRTLDAMSGSRSQGKAGLIPGSKCSYLSIATCF